MKRITELFQNADWVQEQGVTSNDLRASHKFLLTELALKDEYRIGDDLPAEMKAAINKKQSELVNLVEICRLRLELLWGILL